MRKNINKLVAVAIGVSIISGSIIPVFAADTNTQNTSTITSVQAQVKPVLTLDNAIDAAISNSDKIALQIKKINLEDDMLDIKEDIDDDGYLYDKQELIVKQEKEKKDFMEDEIAKDITKRYNDIVTSAKSINKLKKEIDINTKILKDMELKKKLGLVTSIDIENEEIKIETSKNDLKAKEEQLKNNQDYFKVLTDKDLTKYILEQDAQYEVFRIDGSVDEYLDDVIDKYLRYQKESLELDKDNVKESKDQLDDHPKEDEFKPDYDSSDPTKIIKTAHAKYEDALKNYNEQRTKYLSEKYTYSSNLFSIEKNKDDYKKKLKENYASLLELENSINVMKTNIQVKNKELSVAKLRYDLGLITKSDYNTLVVKNEESDLGLRSKIEEYNTLKEQIQKPWIAF